MFNNIIKRIVCFGFGIILFYTLPIAQANDTTRHGTKRWHPSIETQARGLKIQRTDKMAAIATDLDEKLEFAQPVRKDEDLEYVAGYRPNSQKGLPKPSRHRTSSSSLAKSKKSARYGTKRRRPSAEALPLSLKIQLTDKMRAIATDLDEKSGFAEPAGEGEDLEYVAGYLSNFEKILPERSHPQSHSSSSSLFESNAVSSGRTSSAAVETKSEISDIEDLLDLVEDLSITKRTFPSPSHASSLSSSPASEISSTSSLSTSSNAADLTCTIRHSLPLSPQSEYNSIASLMTNAVISTKKTPKSFGSIYSGSSGSSGNSPSLKPLSLTDSRGNFSPVALKPKKRSSSF